MQMNEKQKQFLDELADLLYKHNIESVTVWHDKISFLSNGCELAFDNYNNGVYNECLTSQPDYSTKYAEK